jgi:hypothetical protein
MYTVIVCEYKTDVCQIATGLDNPTSVFGRKIPKSLLVKAGKGGIVTKSYKDGHIAVVKAGTYQGIY